MRSPRWRGSRRARRPGGWGSQHRPSAGGCAKNLRKRGRTFAPNCSAFGLVGGPSGLRHKHLFLARLPRRPGLGGRTRPWRAVGLLSQIVWACCNVTLTRADGGVSQSPGGGVNDNESNGGQGFRPEFRGSESRENRDQRKNGDTTTRNPMRSSRKSGKSLSRLAARTNLTASRNDPPRNTRKSRSSRPSRPSLGL